LEHDPEKWKPVFPRDKREAFARRSCSDKRLAHCKIEFPGMELSEGVPLYQSVSED
jgi:hypothetical protein